jgi:hypothetical protein
MTVSKVEYSDPKGEPASAENEYKDESWMNVTPIFIEDDGEPKALKREFGIEAVPKAVQRISKGEVKIYKVVVGTGVKALDVYLTWTNSSNKLSVTTHDPTGGNRGVNSDSSNGKVDGKISFRITAPQKGTWMFEVHADSVNGNENINFGCKAHI